MCQSGQDPKEVNALIETILDFYWPYHDRQRDGGSSEAKRLWKLFGFKDKGRPIIRAWARYEVKYNKRFGKKACTRELDKFFLTETLRMWDHHDK